MSAAVQALHRCKIAASLDAAEAWVVDDSPTNRRAISAMLRRLGSPVVHDFATASAALRELERRLADPEANCPDILFLDLLMPGLDGIEACRQIQDLLPHPGLPIVIVTTQCTEDAIDDALSAGAVDYVTKPPRPRELGARANVALRLYHELCQTEQREQRASKAERHAARLAAEIAQRRAAERELARLTRVVEQTADSVLITDAAGQIDYVNPAFTALTGYTGDEAIGRTPSLLKSGMHGSGVYRHLWETILAGETYRGVLANRHKDGHVIYVDKTITPLRDEDGQIRHFVSTDRDVTAQRQALSALAASEKRFRDVVQHAPYGIGIVVEGRLQFLNPAGAALLRLQDRRRDWLEQPLAELVAPEALAVVERALARAVHGTSDGTIYTTTFARPDGARFEGEFMATPTEWSGQPAVLLIGRDVSETRRLEQEAAQAQKLAALGHLALTFANEIGNPLAAIDARLERVRLRVDDAEFVRESVALVGGQFRRIERTLQSFAALGLNRHHVATSDLSAVLDASLALIELDPRARGVRITCTLPPEPARLEIVQAQLQQAFVHIGMNALDAMPNGGELHVELIVEAGRVVVAWRDSGTGIAPEHLSRVGEPFFTTKPAERGMGLGLYLSRLFVESHQGRLEIASELGRGTTVRIELPRP